MLSKPSKETKSLKMRYRMPGAENALDGFYDVVNATTPLMEIRPLVAFIRQVR